MRNRIVTDSDIEQTTPSTVAVSGTAIQLSATRLGKTRRTSFIIVPLTASVSVTIVKGGEITQVVANQGIVIVQNQPYVESDTETTDCYQGPIFLIASGAGSVAFTETFLP